MIGGEHLVTLGAVRAVAKKYPDLHIIHFDAHTDLRDDYLGEKLSHATVIRRVWDIIGDNKIYQFGIRSGDKAEFDWSKNHVNMNRYNLNGIDECIEKLKDKPVYFTLDLDVLDPSVFPGTGTPEAGGVNFNDLLSAILKLNKLNIVGCELNELSPVYDQSGASTAVACKILRELLLTINTEKKEGFEMGRALIIGCGGVASVAINKCCQNSDVFEEICIASRTKGKCDALREKLENTTKTKITTAQVDADDVNQLVSLINTYKPDVVLNLALPYQDLTIMDACLETKTHYIDTANYEPVDTAKFEYKWQWAYREKFDKAGITALLGCGFDPGVTGVFSAYAMKHYFDEIHYIDILDANAGDHGYPFATNFNPEINIREVTAKGSYWEDGHWVETEPMEIKRVFNFPEIGDKDMYLLHHEELESLALNIKGIKRIRFFMTFGQSYLTHLKCLENVGMTSIEPIEFEGKMIVPLQFLKAVLPDPASLGPRTKGKTNIGCIFTGVKDGKTVHYYVYNVCDHQACYHEVGSQAISYTTGVPAMIGAMLVMDGTWRKPGVYNVEEFDPDPFMEALNKWGLPWQEEFNPTLVD